MFDTFLEYPLEVSMIVLQNLTSRSQRNRVNPISPTEIWMKSFLIIQPISWCTLTYMVWVELICRENLSPWNEVLWALGQREAALIHVISGYDRIIYMSCMEIELQRGKIQHSLTKITHTVSIVNVSYTLTIKSYNSLHLRLPLSFRGLNWCHSLLLIWTYKWFMHNHGCQVSMYLCRIISRGARVSLGLWILKVNPLSAEHFGANQ